MIESLNRSRGGGEGSAQGRPPLSSCLRFARAETRSVLAGPARPCQCCPPVEQRVEQDEAALPRPPPQRAAARRRPPPQSAARRRPGAAPFVAGSPMVHVVLLVHSTVRCDGLNLNDRADTRARGVDFRIFDFPRELPLDSQGRVTAPTSVFVKSPEESKIRKFETEQRRGCGRGRQCGRPQAGARTRALGGEAPGDPHGVQRPLKTAPLDVLGPTRLTGALRR